METNRSPEARDARIRLSLNEGWRFFRYPDGEAPDELIYDVRPEAIGARDDRPADEKPTEAVSVEATKAVLKPWILPSANPFLPDPARRRLRPAGAPGADFPFVQADFDDRGWQAVDLPHDWAISGPFYEGHDAPIGGSMGRLPTHGVAWYRKTLDLPEADAESRLTLEIDGAMAYAMVWLNGHLVGGWPYGYASFSLDLTPYAHPGRPNTLAIRLDNPPDSGRWYSGAGLYRNVWLTRTGPIRVAPWGVFVTTPEVSAEAATIRLQATLESFETEPTTATVSTTLYALDAAGQASGEPIARFAPVDVVLAPGETASAASALVLPSPRLWGPPPTQTPHRYIAVTTLERAGSVVDRVETRFGIRTLAFVPERGVLVNGERVFLQGVNQHHDLGALGAAFHVRAAERQLERLREAGCNAIRMAHNPPAPELLELTDRLGFLVVDEIFDVWERKKPPLDFHLIFPDWHEPDLRALIRRDRNCPSVILWSIGNEVGEQYADEEGAALARRLHEIAQEEDPTRPTTVSMNYAKPHMPFAAAADVISLNYQGEGIRFGPGYAHLEGIRTPPLFPAFRERFPEKLLISSENAAAVSSRSEYLFPVIDVISAPVEDGAGGDPARRQVSAYELYTVPFGSSADRVFASEDQHPYVAGGFVWTGFDYLGEPTPYYLSRSSYFGFLDLAGFPKDRFYLYQSRWRPELPMAHLLPHWTWPERLGEVTPVHVFTSGDEAELFLNDRSLGRRKKGAFEYRLRWDDVRYEPGTIRVVAYRDGREWATDAVTTAGAPARLRLAADRASGEGLLFLTAQVVDASGNLAPRADPAIRFSVEGEGRLLATDNGDATDMTPFPSPVRRAFHGLALAIVAGSGALTVRAEAESLEGASLSLPG